jgi:hypothetical protein
VSAPRFFRRLAAAFRQMRPGRALLLVLAALAAALLSDWLRPERVVFPAPLPVFRTVSRAP